MMIEPLKKPEHIGDRLKLFMDEHQIKVKQVAEIFGVERPSVYDWLKFGRMDKKHYATLVQWSKLPIEYWLGMPIQSNINDNEVREPTGAYMTPRISALIQLFNAVTKADQDEIIRSLNEKKQGYDALFRELLEKRA